VQTLDACSRRGADIVRQVLMFARGVKGSRVALQPAQLLGEMERMIRETFPKSIELVVHHGLKPWQVQGDATQLQQVLMNLCVNARDAMPEGGTLSLCVENVELSAASASLHPKARPGFYTMFAVADTGTGIPPELMEKIFDPFFTTKPLGHGTGLGLATVMGICESHNGFVLVDSTPGKGTIFKVYLPALREAKPGAAGKPEKVAVPRGRGERILVVDDEPAIRRITYVILSNNGYEAFLAANGHEAVELFRQNQDAIQLVITDLMMPKMDGPATIRALRQIRPDVKTIMVTGLGDENRMGDASAAGASDFLSKPFTSEQLLLKMAALLRGKDS
jgi:CheY-like chemotaxis protein